MEIKGIPIILNEKVVTGVDGFNREIVEENPVTIENVVIGQPTSDDVLNEVNLSGKTISYVLAIPAGDAHDWENTTVEFYGRKWKTVGAPMQFMDGFMGKDFPWNKKVKVTTYE